MLDLLSYLGNENLLFDSLKHHVGFEPTPSAWKAEILAIIRMVHGGAAYCFTWSSPRHPSGDFNFEKRLITQP